MMINETYSTLDLQQVGEIQLFIGHSVLLNLFAENVQ